jgi:hypothetical protein
MRFRLAFGAFVLLIELKLTKSVEAVTNEIILAELSLAQFM